MYRSTKVGKIFLKVFIWAGVKVGKDIIEGKIYGHNLPKLFQNTKALYFY